MNPRTSVLGASAIAILWAFAACGGDDSTATSPDASTDATEEPAVKLDAGMDTAVADTGTDAMTGCNNLGNSAPNVMQQYAAGEAPVPAGGTIPDGKYFVTGSSVFVGDAGLTGPTGAVLKQTEVVSGNTFQLVSFEGTVIGSVTQTGTYTVNADASVVAVTTCPAPDQRQLGFDSDGGTLTIYTPHTDAGPSISLTLTRQ
ncbi:MAG: hypothetical protein ABIP39_14245 [Polyangiaceae bacterium]